MPSVARISLFAAIGAWSSLVEAQFPPAPEGVTVLESKTDDGVRISYKENDLCETTEGVRSYSGYVHLPANSLDNLGVRNQSYEINTFFWFFESRKDPQNAPLSIWMNGGPGSSSMLGLLRENGPCYIHSDSNSTYLSEWSWNNEVNLLYLEQPVQVGFSYDELTNVTVSSEEGVEVADFSDQIPEQNNTFYIGTYPSQDTNFTTVGTENSARALWNFAQVWFQEFPGYKPNDSRVSIATESYGGRYGPAFAAYFQEQNQRISNGTWNETGQTHILHLDTLLIINGCIDRYVQWPGYLKMLYNNTYGIQAINESRFESVTNNLYREGGCLDQIEQCRNLSLAYDPTNQGFNASVNTVCEEAETFCTEEIRDPYFDSDLNYYDVSAPGAASFPPPWYEGWLNQPHVQSGLGVPLNWTQSNGAVSTAFRSIGDYPRPGWKEDLAYLLEEGIKVTLVYGDRDYACNWYGGELLSLAIPWSHQEDFQAAGYAPLVVNSSYIGGQTRQFGNLSFTRVYQAGHEVPAYQPETAYKIFMRSLFNNDVATGNVSTLENEDYNTKGPSTVFNITSKPVTLPGSQCYVLDKEQCTADQWETVLNGTAEVRNWIVVDANTTSLFSDSGNSTGGNQTSPSGTGTPSATESGGGASPTESEGVAVAMLRGGEWRVGGSDVSLYGSAVLAALVGSVMVML
ncbi:alpha/beta-hydrolase [Polyplosphaeria fusca]|uniref:Carboxypeptidase n=1 Tax=Polyplosphaeria fusca TaxID=682080 RepID=A0A9P4QRX5_9PLEO|nr:alpha/beta-hydrolase [Polyplosphaeria fusca]